MSPSDPMPTYPRDADIEVLGLEFDADPSQCRFELVPAVARHDGGLYGGTATAVSIAAMEAATDRPALSVTTQFVATAALGDTIDCTTTVLALGGQIAQTQVVGRHGDRILFVSIGCTARPRAEGLTGQYQVMPAVTAPHETSAVHYGPPRSDGFLGFTEQVEFRPASAGAAWPGFALWARIRGDRPLTPASIAFAADMVPMAVARAAQRVGGGTTIDNTLRFGDVSDVEGWILLELIGHLSVGAHGVGSVNVWSETGLLLAVGSQATNMKFVFTEAQVAAMESFGTFPG